MTAKGGVVLFDGECRLCQFWVRFVVPRDPLGLFRFAPIASPAARALLLAHGGDAPGAGTVVLIEGGRVFTKSTAALRIARRLTWPWSWAGCLLRVPAPLRDAAYDIVARNRVRWFGRSQSCALLTDEARARFIDDAAR